MRWKKLGRIFLPCGAHPKLASHAANPLAVWLEGDVFRVYYSGRDAQNRSSVSYVDVDICTHAVVHDPKRPVFEHGPAGSFYSHGVSIGNCYEVAGRRYILFMGWQVPDDGHWRGDVGRLELLPTGELQLSDEQPVLAVDAEDPVSLSYPWVMQDVNGTYRMWYGSTLTWDAGNGEMLHVIKQACSPDGRCWQRHGVAVPYGINTAQAFSRPTVLHEQGQGYHMWFSYRSGRGETYRIGYARSADAEHWELRLDESGITPSASGWDAEMIEYPFVFAHKGQYFMLYNGNGYGLTGFGLAILE